MTVETKTMTVETVSWQSQSQVRGQRYIFF